MRVLALVTDAFGGYGGIAQYNRDFLTALSRAPYIGDIQVLPRNGAPEDVPEKVRQHSARSGRLAYARAAVVTARKLRPDAIICGHLYHGPVAASIARALDVPMVSQLYGTEVWTSIAQRHRAPLEASRLILTVSRDTRDRILKQIDIAPEKVVVLNTTFGDDYVPGDAAADRRKWLLGDEFTVLTVARLDTRDGYKGHDLVIEQVAALAREGVRIRYLVAGVGDDRPRLERLAQSSGVAEQVRFLGMVPREELPGLYRAADLFALPSKGEGFGIVFVEAVASGTPAIGLAVGGAPDALADGELGCCVCEAEFPTAFRALVNRRSASAREDALQRASLAHQRFGFAAFERRVGLLLQDLV